ncbi:MAG: glycoside hydrolase family 10 protein [Planctomycetota bacterium]|jgi:uncharacterized lipoprotein YddW (UPF0748 family)
MRNYVLILLVAIMLMNPTRLFADVTDSADSNPALKYVCEARGAWGEPGRGMSWDAAMKALKEAGFNMVLPNVCTAGRASYPSDFLPQTTERDELKLCIEAAHKYGIEVHAWRINWFMLGCPESFTEKMVKEGRVQYSYEGKRNPEVARDNGYKQNRDWLCPSQEVNRKLELDTMLEMVKKYDVDGVHFDYMRYGWEQMCYCDKCQVNFQKKSGLKVGNWPGDVWKGGKYYQAYLDWRRYLITSSAREIAKAIHDYDPYACVSLAARSGVNWANTSDAQEWWEWTKEGFLDFICPMTYSTEPEKFADSARQLLPLVNGDVPYYGGIGVYKMESYEPLAKVIDSGRELGQDGFINFNLRRLIPYLDKVKAKLGKPALLAHRAPQTHFIIEADKSETKDGLKVFSPGKTIKFKTSIMFCGKLKEGISRIKGDIILQKTSGEIINKICSVDFNTSDIVTSSFKPEKQGKYRLGLFGVMTLSTGAEKPFITRSFPFEIGAL